MTAATVTKYFETHNPNEESVQLTCTDGETYTTRKIKFIDTVTITSSEDMGAETNSFSYSKSGRVITFYADGVTDKKIDVIIKGRQG